MGQAGRNIEKLGGLRGLALANTSLPAGFSHCTPQLVNFSLILEVIIFQSAAERELRQMGMPRYLKDLQLETRGN
jgi:hypothetical protein